MTVRLISSEPGEAGTPSSIPAATSAAGDCTQHFGACKITADLTVADVTQVEFNDFVAGEAECLGEVLGAIFEAQDDGLAQLVDGFFAFSLDTENEELSKMAILMLSAIRRLSASKSLLSTLK